jgi:hypothetical protein
MPTDQPIRRVYAALLEWLSASRAVDRLQIDRERNVVAALREDSVEPRGEIAEERIAASGPAKNAAYHRRQTFLSMARGMRTRKKHRGQNQDRKSSPMAEYSSEDQGTKR